MGFRQFGARRKEVRMRMPMPKDSWDEVTCCFMRSRAFRSREMAQAARGLLGRDEVERLTRLRSDLAARDYLAAHALLHALLARVTGVRANALRLCVTPSGRPVLHESQARQIRFSLSHANGMVLCAVARGCDLGADVESLAELAVDSNSVAEILCTPSELAAFNSLPECARLSCLARRWTLAEAMAKIGGMGLADLPTQTVTGTWHIVSHQLSPAYWCSVALRDPAPGRVVARFEEWIPEMRDTSKKSNAARKPHVDFMRGPVSHMTFGTLHGVRPLGARDCVRMEAHD